MSLNGKELGINEEECEKMQKVASKYGVQMVCDEEDEKKEEGLDLGFIGEENCENVKKTVSKYGVAVVCDEEK